jgi:hypothetical protein
MEKDIRKTRRSILAKARTLRRSGRMTEKRLLLSKEHQKSLTCRRLRRPIHGGRFLEGDL